MPQKNNNTEKYLERLIKDSWVHRRMISSTWTTYPLLLLTLLTFIIITFPHLLAQLYSGHFSVIFWWLNSYSLLGSQMTRWGVGLLSPDVYEYELWMNCTIVPGMDNYRGLFWYPGTIGVFCGGQIFLKNNFCPGASCCLSRCSGITPVMMAFWNQQNIAFLPVWSFWNMSIVSK